jgi:hypothetical protein
MKKESMKATSLRTLLIVVILLLIAGSAGAFYYGLQRVRDFAEEVARTSADANASGDQIDKLQELKNDLAESETLVNKANQVFSTPQAYQADALKAVQKYAGAYGLTVSNTNFDVQSPAGAKAFVITLASPADYESFLRFLNAIEGNVPKMQVTSLKVERPDSGSGSEIKIGDISITIATR